MVVVQWDCRLVLDLVQLGASLVVTVMRQDGMG